MQRTWLISVLFALGACTQATQPGVEISHARSPAPPPGATVAAVYAELRATHDDKLLHAQTTIADKVEVHSTSHENGMSQMRPVDALELKAGVPVEFAPGGLHFMIMGLQELPTPSTRFPLTLHFEKAGEVTVEVNVVEPGEMHHH